MQLLNFERTSCEALKVFFPTDGKIKSYHLPRWPPIEPEVAMSIVVAYNWYALFYFLNDASIWDLQSLVCFWNSHKNRISWNFQGSMPWSGWKYAGTAITGSSQVMDVQRNPAVQNAKQWQVSSKSFQTFQTWCRNFWAVAQLWRCSCQMGRFSNSWNRWCWIEKKIAAIRFHKVSQECYSLQHKYHFSILIHEEMRSQTWDAAAFNEGNQQFLEDSLGHIWCSDTF